MNTPYLTPDPASLSRDGFIKTYGGIYEHAEWVAEAIADQGRDARDRDPSFLARRMQAVVNAAPYEKKLALLRAHPELVGKLALAGKLTAHSTNEQASAGLDACSAEEFAAFQSLNTRYTSAFGFPFIIAVRDHTRASILAAFRERINNSFEDEFDTAIRETHRIARLRLGQMTTSI
ncbi:2-oxo-4-hydroxy-4-carboxy-5-ureidoimidazoline decarboxylase [Alphaproteobacteria bacterium LSUCC0684]